MKQFLADPHHKLVLLLIGLALSKGLLLAAIIPPWWQGHDEEYHYAQTQWLLGHFSEADTTPQQEMIATFAAFPPSRWTPSSPQPVNVASIWGRYQSLSRPSLAYYLYAAPGTLLAHQHPLVQLNIYRWVSVLLTAGTVVFAFLSARIFFPKSRPFQLLPPLLILLLPSYMITGSTVTDGNLAIFLSTVIFYLLLLDVQAPRPTWRTALAAGLTLLALFSKATAYFLLPVWVVLVVVYFLSLNWRNALWLLLPLAAMIGASFFLPARFQILIEEITQNPEAVTAAFSYVTSLRYYQVTFFFFWVILGWGVYPIALEGYLFTLAMTALGLSGLLIYAVQAVRRGGLTLKALTTEQKRLLLALLFVVFSFAGLIALAIINAGELGGRSARYVFPVIVPIFTLLAVGWRTLLPTQWEKTGVLAIVGLFFLFDLAVWLGYALPWYYPLWVS